MAKATLTLPFLPPRAVSPNGAHGHWRTHWSARRKLREDTFMVAMSQQIPAFTKARIQITYVFPMNRRRDGDNYLAMFKGCADGLVDAKVLLADDSEHVSYAPVVFIVDKDRSPRTIIEIEEA